MRHELMYCLTYRMGLEFSFATFWKASLHVIIFLLLFNHTVVLSWALKMSYYLRFLDKARILARVRAFKHILRPGRLISAVRSIALTIHLLKLIARALFQSIWSFPYMQLLDEMLATLLSWVFRLDMVEVKKTPIWPGAYPTSAPVTNQSEDGHVDCISPRFSVAPPVHQLPERSIANGSSLAFLRQRHRKNLSTVLEGDEREHAYDAAAVRIGSEVPKYQATVEDFDENEDAAACPSLPETAAIFRSGLASTMQPNGTHLRRRSVKVPHGGHIPIARSANVGLPISSSNALGPTLQSAANSSGLSPISPKTRRGAGASLQIPSKRAPKVRVVELSVTTNNLTYSILTSSRAHSLPATTLAWHGVVAKVSDTVLWPFRDPWISFGLSPASAGLRAWKFPEAESNMSPA